MWRRGLLAAAPICLIAAPAWSGAASAQEINTAGKGSIAETDFVVVPAYRWFTSGLAAKRIWIVRKRASGGRGSIDVKIKGEDAYVHLADGQAGDTVEAHPVFLNIVIIRRTTGFDRKTFYYECQKEGHDAITCSDGEELH